MAEIVNQNRNDGISQTVERSKCDATKLAIKSYLARRQYSENDTEKKSISCEQMLITQLVATETARPNSILYSNSSYRNTFNNDPNPVPVEDYYNRFVTWVNNLQVDSDSTIRNDLSKFVCPLFCHLYLDLLQSSHQHSAKVLLDCYQEYKNIYVSELCGQVIEEFNHSDVKSRPIIKSFRSSKHKIKVSSEAVNALKKFLSKNGHVLILQVFQTWFDIEISLMCSNKKTEMDENEFETFSACNGDVPDEEMDMELKELQEAIQAVRQQSPPVLLMNVFNSQDNATCGLVDGEQKKAIVGFSTSDIHVWGLGNSELLCPKVIGNASRISLGCDKNIINQDDLDDDLDPRTCTGAVILRGHSESVQDVKIVPGADVLLSVSQDCTMRAWKFSDYSCAAIYKGHNYPIWCLDVSIFGMYIATGSYDRSVRLWSLDRIYPTRILAGHIKDVNSIHFHPNASYFATGSADKTIRMWSVTDCKTVRLLLGHKGVVYSVAFSPDGQYLASGGEDKCVRIWDLTAAKQLCELNGGMNVVTGLTWSKDNKRLASISLDGYVREWNTETVIKNSTNSSTDVDDNTNTESSSVFNTGYTSLLNIKYDKSWLTCLSASAVCLHS